VLAQMHAVVRSTAELQIVHVWHSRTGVV
jgi:hypothetical protein